MDLVLDPVRYAVGRLPPEAPIPELGGDFISVTRSADELSLVGPERSLPEGAEREDGWRRLEVVGPLAFSEVGVLAALADALARAGIPIFVISTYDTDHLLVKEAHLERAVVTLREEGHRVRTPT